MILHYVFHIIILMICPIYSLANESLLDPPIAQPGCNSKCGGVLIPYPFGMKDPKCYAGEWFKIECRNTTSKGGQSQTPYLKSLDWEVQSISEGDSRVEIMNPVFVWNCKGKTNKPAIDLKGSPFVYSQVNKFVAAGCKKLVFLLSSGSTVGGCVSICDDLNDIVIQGNGGCFGRSCCETSLPMSLSEYNATLSNQTDDGSTLPMCTYAFIASADWLQSYYNSTKMRNQSSNEQKSLVSVPAVLDWKFPYAMLNNVSNSYCHIESDGSNSNSNSNSDSKSNSNEWAKGSKAASATSNSRWRCNCPIGFYGNPYISGSCVARPGFFPKKSRSKKWFIVGISSSIGSIILLFGLWWSYKVVRKRVIKKRREKIFKKNGGLLLQRRLSSGEVNVDKAILFTLKDLERATDKFNINRVLGKGGQGTVYKGMLEDGKIVAVKKFKVQGKVEEFINEFVILSQINHRNVVKLLGCCLETEIPLLVYEFIPNGNLFEYLHSQNEDLPMTWDMRLRIATEIAGALFYLHSVASQPIYHRDIKSTNILLDEKYRAKVADFGTSRIVSIEATHLTTVVQGTLGYLDPEYFYTSQFTDKSDVYSFGVVLAELLTGKKPISVVSSEEAKNLASYFALSMDENNLFDIIDKRLEMEAEKEHIIAVANLAYTCLELNGRKRPTMKEVTLELERIRGQDKKFNTNQNHEEIELSRIEEYQHFDGYSQSNTLAAIDSEITSSVVIPILTTNG